MSDAAGELRGVVARISGGGRHPLVGADLGEAFAKGSVAAGVGRSIDETEKDLSFPIAGWIDGVIGKELDGTSYW